MTIRTQWTAHRMHRRTPRELSHELRGTPASSGRITGRARILRRTRDAAGLKQGDIIVCPSLTPEIAATPTLPAGIVTEHGGPLSSGAILAREFGVPAVFAVPGATTLIHDGQLLTLDGSTGMVTLHG